MFGKTMAPHQKDMYSHAQHFGARLLWIGAVYIKDQNATKQKKTCRNDFEGMPTGTVEVEDVLKMV